MIFGHKLTDGDMIALEIGIKSEITDKIIYNRLYRHDIEDLYCLDIATKNEEIRIRFSPKKDGDMLDLYKLREQIKDIVERINKKWN